MKTAISIPDQVFRDAEALARRLDKSRSQLYAEAVAAYVARHDEDAVTEAMDAALDALEDDTTSAFVREAGRRLLRDEEW